MCRNRLRHLGNLRALKLVGNIPLTAEDDERYRDPLADIAGLRSLEIVSDEILHDLAPLIRCQNLRELTVSGHSGLRDLSALAFTSVERLDLHTTSTSGASIDLGTLAGASIRQLSIGHPELANGLHSLPDDLRLTELSIVNPAERRSLLGISRWPTLTTVAVHGALAADELAELGRLPNLRHLVLYGVSEEEADAARAAVAPLGVTVEVHTAAGP